MDRHVGPAQFVHFSRVGVEMDDSGAWRKFGELSGGSVIEARADDDQKVRLLYSEVRLTRAMHTEHAEVHRVRGRQRAEASQREHGGQLRRLNELEEGIDRTAERDTAAAVDQGP